MWFDGIKVNIQPPTAGAHLPMVDSGSMQVVVALTLFIWLEAAISHIVGMKLPIQKHLFDLAIGTSSALALFSQGRSVDEYLQQFIWHATKAFRRRPYPTCLLILCHVVDCIYSFAADGQYSADSIEESLKEAFCAEQDLLVWNGHWTAGTMYIGSIMYS
ncbi:hypothetical protein C7212DRAFT_347344 [Tuber magnatum]|uniref:Uncharacterized protein n=1 Tax=Tuber magnatum TaxID=42249 RepID=A0A317SEM9_9PEZI|nr:hypothetical protein C7212DRAFT_347344 [Tuber magnatum]